MRLLSKGILLSLGIFVLSALTGCIFTTNPGPACTGNGECQTGESCISGTCQVDNGPPATCDGDLRVSWAFGGIADCPDNVDKVVIKLFDPTGAAVHAGSGDLINCGDGSRTYTNLACGTYQIQVQAIDIDEAFTWTAPQGPVDITDGQVADINADMEQE